MEARIAVKKIRRFLRRYRKLIRLILLAAFAVWMAFYLMAFFSKGVTFMEVFLKKGSAQNAVIYTGRDNYGEILLTVHQRSRSEIDISYQLPYNKLKTYTLTLTENERKNPELPASYHLTIQAGSGSILFDGNYRRGDPFLYTKANLPDTGDIDTRRQGKNPYLNFEPNLRRMVGIATGEYEQMRGEWLYLLLGAGVLLLVWLDSRIPLFSQRMQELLVDKKRKNEEIGRLLGTLVRTAAVIVGIGFLLAAI